MWYGDNKKVAHMEEKLVDDLINNLKKHFGELVVNRRKKHTFSGMNVNITEEKKLR